MSLSVGFGIFASNAAGLPTGIQAWWNNQDQVFLVMMTFLALEIIDARLGFRDYLMDWLIAAAAIILQSVGAWYIALLMGSGIRFAVLWPQVALGVIAYPVAARLVLALDRWRLAR